METVVPGHAGSVTCVVHLGGGWLATSSRDTTVRIWSVRGILVKCQLVLRGHSDHVDAVAAAGQAKLASASDDKTVRIWRL